MFTTTAQTFEFTGTAKDFENKGIKLNGKHLNAVAVGALALHSLIEDAGEGQKPARGRTPRMYRAVSRDGMVFSAPDAV
jgi:hypothetical protein